jgi:hypothetical protein
MNNLRIKFQMPFQSGSLVITMKLKAKDNSCADAMLLICILQKVYLNKKVAHF